jgi:transaldolase / glucose-6-phosphate isomerase
LETDLLTRHFLDRARARLGAGAGAQFIAITDPGSRLQGFAEANGFRAVVTGEPSIGGRYSALSAFGMVPAALIGLDLDAFVSRARRLAEAAGPAAAAFDNPALSLGLALGALARAGQDKLTLLASPSLQPFGAWLEQLIAESTGKRGLGIVPVEGEPELGLSEYLSDRVFFGFRQAGEEGTLAERLRRLAGAGHPVIEIELTDQLALGAEFFRWELATAIAAAVMGVNPFDQPDVEAAKQATREIAARLYERNPQVPRPSGTPVLESDGLALYMDDANAHALAPGSDGDLGEVLAAHIARAGGGDYVALTAFLPMLAPIDERLQELRAIILERRPVATTLGYGPRYLHSTGQLHKGGGPNGLFLQITGDPASDLPSGEGRLTFGDILAAQAAGDFAVLSARGRRLMRVHLVGDTLAGLDRLIAAMRGT